MRLILLTSLLFFSISCSTTTRFISYSGDVSIEGLNASISTSSVFFNAESVTEANTRSIIDERGDYYLNLILDGYYQQTGHLKFSDDKSSPMHFDVKQVDLKTGYFTLNIVDPGPIIKMTMIVDVYYYGNLVDTEIYKARVNMAQVVNPERMWNWLTTEERQEVNNQLAAFEVGLRTLYRNLFFKHLDISLVL